MTTPSGGQYSFDLQTVHADNATGTLGNYIKASGIKFSNSEQLQAYEDALLDAGKVGTVFVPDIKHPYRTQISASPGSSVSLHSMNGNDTLFASASGNDTLYAGSHHDTLVGGAGHDTLYGSTSAIGGALLVSGSWAGGGSQLFAGLGKDTLFGGAGADTLHGGAGKDILFASSGSGSEVIGGSGNETIFGSSVHGAAGAQLHAGDGARVLIESFGANDTMYAGSGKDTLVGGSGDVVMYGPSSAKGSAVLDAGTGNDVLYAAPGADTLSAGTGTLHGHGGSHVVFDLSNPNIGNDTVWGGGTSDSNATTVRLGSDRSNVSIDTNGNEITVHFTNASDVAVTETLHNITEIVFKDGPHKV
jgi:Ca2+-binding RTX toxin-like protein